MYILFLLCYPCIYEYFRVSKIYIFEHCDAAVIDRKELLAAPGISPLSSLLVYQIPLDIRVQ